jgi:hypothetical protein
MAKDPFSNLFSRRILHTIFEERSLLTDSNSRLKVLEELIQA